MNDDCFDLEKELFAELTRFTVSNNIHWNLLPGTEEPVVKANFRAFSLTIEQRGSDCQFSIEDPESNIKFIYCDQNLAQELMRLAYHQATAKEANLPTRGSDQYNHNLKTIIVRLRSNI